MELTLEEKFAKVRDLRPIDDVFFEVLASEKAVCEEILRTIMEDPQLVVENVEVQNSLRNLYGRSVRLDALCTLSNGKKVNIEVQRSNDDDHLRRVRFNAASVTVKASSAGTDFRDVIELYVIYISEFDFLKEGKTTYHIDKVIRETGTVVDDGLHEIFVNTTIDDGTDTADLMTCFLKKQVSHPKFPALSKQVYELKSTEGGVTCMCKVMQEYEEKAKQEGIRIGKQEGIQIGEQRGILVGAKNQSIKNAEKSIIRGKLTLEEIAEDSGLSLEEVQELAKKRTA